MVLRSQFVDKTKFSAARLTKKSAQKNSSVRTSAGKIVSQAPILEEVAEVSAKKVLEDDEHKQIGQQLDNIAHGKRPLRVLVAGAGIGGLVFALAAKKRGLDVVVFERDLTAIRGEGQYRGPIQIQSNALAALEAVDVGVAEEVMASGCVTGDRINGLVDGLTGEWYVKFDTLTPAVERGLPVTRVISRMTLQEILARAVGPDLIRNGTTVEDFNDDGEKVSVTLQDGTVYEGDLLVGADGIRSKVREKLLGPKDATYSDYTCYTGIADFVPADIENVGYRVFLGHKQYFVSSDVGHGKMQWYAFYNEPAGGTDVEGGRQSRLLSLFGGWCDGVVDLLQATPEPEILRRDIYDRVPIMTWGRGRVTLLGDSAHAMQPNMGQGGCMAIEDGYQLALDLDKALEEGGFQNMDIPGVLKKYEGERRMRVGAIHGMARMAAIMASTYKAYLGEGLGPLSWITKLRIPHPGKVGGQFIVKYSMPLMLQWILGGNQGALEGRAPYCRLEDKAKGNMKEWLANDDALERATEAGWYLIPSGERMTDVNMTSSGKAPLHISSVSGSQTFVGSEASASEDEEILVINALEVSPRHARIDCEDGSFYVTDLKGSTGTLVIRVDGAECRVSPEKRVRLHPGDSLKFGSSKEGLFKIKLYKTEAYSETWRN